MIEATNPTETTLLSRLTGALRRHPRQASLMGFLLLVFAVMWGRLLLSGRLPVQAAADTATAAGGTDNGFQDASDHSGAAQGPRNLAEWARQTTGPINRNLFAVPLEAYPIDPNHPPPSDSSAKSSFSQADQNRERQLLVQQVEAKATHLNLEGIVVGAAPKAWINGILVGVGQSISDSGFTVVKIEANRIIIQRDGVQVELSMAK